MNLKDYIDKLINLQRNKKYNDAKTLLSEALSIYPDNKFLKKYEISLLSKTGKLDDALNLANSLFGMLKDDEYFIQTYIGLLEKSRLKNNLKEFIEKITMDLPDFSERFYNYLKQVILRNFSSDEAEKFISGLPIKNKKIQVNNYKTYKEKFSKMPPEAAIAEIENLMMLPSYKNDFDLNLLLAGFYRNVGKYEEALKIYNNLLTVKESTFLYKMTGYTYYRLKDFSNALKYLKEVLRKETDDHILIQTIYKIYEKDKNYEDFKKLIESVLAEKPSAKKLYGYLKKASKWQKKN